MNRTNPFELLESRVLMSTAHMPTFHTPVPIAPIVMPLTQMVPARAASVGVPTGLQAQIVGTNQLRLTWQGDGSATLGYTIERSSTGKGGWNNIGTTGVNGRSFTVLNVNQFPRYFYRLVAAGNSGAVAFSNVVETPALRHLLAR